MTLLKVPCPNSFKARHLLFLESPGVYASKYSCRDFLCRRGKFAVDKDESLSLLSAPVLLDGGVGGVGIGASPLCTAKCGSLRIGISVAGSGVASTGAWEPETVICRGFGTCIASGIYSLMLRFLPCSSAFFSLFICSPDSFGVAINPWYALRFDWFAMAADMDSPFAVTRAESAVMGIMSSREGGREVSCFQGPGESPVISGEGSGVTSGIAFSIGEDKAELGAEPKFELLPTLVAKTFFILGVRFKPNDVGFEGILVNSLGLRPVVFALASVTVYPGIMSVCIRNPALRGLEC